MSCAGGTGTIPFLGCCPITIFQLEVFGLNYAHTWITQAELLSSINAQVANYRPEDYPSGTKLQFRNGYVWRGPPPGVYVGQLYVLSGAAAPEAYHMVDGRQYENGNLLWMSRFQYRAGEANPSIASWPIEWYWDDWTPAWWPKAGAPKDIIQLDQQVIVVDFPELNRVTVYPSTLTPYLPVALQGIHE